MLAKIAYSYGGVELTEFAANAPTSSSFEDIIGPLRKIDVVDSIVDALTTVGVALQVREVWDHTLVT